MGVLTWNWWTGRASKNSWAMMYECPAGPGQVGTQHMPDHAAVRVVIPVGTSSSLWYQDTPTPESKVAVLYGASSHSESAVVGSLLSPAGPTRREHITARLGGWEKGLASSQAGREHTSECGLLQVTEVGAGVHQVDRQGAQDAAELAKHLPGEEEEEEVDRQKLPYSVCCN